MLAYVHLYTLFMVVPIFNSMMRIDRSLLEAARDGGASGWQTLCERHPAAVQARHRHRLDLRRHHRDGRLRHRALMSGGQSASVGLMMMNAMSLLQYPAAAANAVVLLIAGAADRSPP